jgi:predicted nucleic acid-binding protein
VKIVIDSSIAGAWSFKDESTAETDRIAELVEVHGAWVPQLFPTEIANVLLVAVRRKRIDAVHLDRQLAFLTDLNLSIDTETSEHAWHTTVRLAREERLTVYDATYLELALRAGADLATLDKELAAAAQRRGVTVLP